MSVLSLQSIYSRPEALSDADPLVRVSAIHHAGLRFKQSRDASILSTLNRLLQDGDSLVSRYAAVTLAQNFDKAGVRWLLDQAIQTRGKDLELLDCLKACTHFPFLGLICEYIDVSSVPADRSDLQQLLNGLIESNINDFQDQADRNLRWREDVLKTVASLDKLNGVTRNPGKFMQLGVLLSVSEEFAPGFVWVPETGGFFPYYSECVSNQGALASGADVLFIANPHNLEDEVQTMYVFTSPELPSKSDLASKVIQFSVFNGAATVGPLQPGIVLQRLNSKSVMIYFADGTCVSESRYANDAEPGQLVLCPPFAANDLDRRARAFFVPGIKSHSKLGLNLLRNHLGEIQRNPRALLGTVQRVFPQHNTAYLKTQVQVHRPDNAQRNFLIKKAAPQDKVLLVECDHCHTEGIVPCTNCQGTKEVKCSGEYTCGYCRGTGKTRAGYTCTRCPDSHRVKGCEGTGVNQCLRCNGAKEVTCPNCRGTGNHKEAHDCPGCEGRGHRKFTCPSCNPPGSGSCFICDGTGLKFGNTCRKCDGSGQCKNCAGAGHTTASCRNCDSKGKFAAVPCNTCRTSGKCKCLQCKGQGTRECAVCFGYKRLRCRHCKGSGKFYCNHCRSSGYVVIATVDQALCR